MWVNRVKLVLLEYLYTLIVLGVVTTSVIVLILLSFSNTMVSSVEQKREISHHVLGQSTDRLFWFIQISDIHLSDLIPQVYQRFDRFCSEDISVIRPAFVLCTGDISDSKSHVFISEPNEDQFKKYRDILQRHNLYNASFWFDLRGNHDVYGVTSYGSKFDYFSKYSVVSQSPQHDPTQRVQSFVYKTGYGSYRFVSVDLNLVPGIHLPLNYFGLADRDIIRQTREQLTNNSSAFNHTILLGHYPTAAIHSSVGFGEPKFSSLYDPSEAGGMGQFTAYLSGHLHLRHILARRPQGYLELALSDFKAKNSYRILAFDSDVFSMVDTQLGEWPAILVTNPKRSDLLSENEPFNLIKKSTHVRALVFSPCKIVKAQLEIDGVVISENMHRANPTMPLYTHPWSPSAFTSESMHSLKVTAKDSCGNKRSVTIPFNTRNKSSGLPLFGNLILSLDFFWMPFAIFVVLWAYVVFGLLIIPKVCRLVMTSRGQWNKFDTRMRSYLKLFFARKQTNDDGYSFTEMEEELHEDNNLDCDIKGMSFWGDVKMTFQANLWRFAQIPIFVWIVLLTFGLYMPCGVWFAGNLIDDSISYAFVWGIYTDHFVRTSSNTFLFMGLPILLFIYHPLVTYMALPFQYYSLFAAKGNMYTASTTLCQRIRQAMLPFGWLNFIGCLWMFSVGIFLAVFYGTAYGKYALLISPLILDLLIFTLLAVVYAHKLDPKSL